MARDPKTLQLGSSLPQVPCQVDHRPPNEFDSVQRRLFRLSVVFFQKFRGFSGLPKQFAFIEYNKLMVEKNRHLEYGKRLETTL